MDQALRHRLRVRLLNGWVCRWGISRHWTDPVVDGGFCLESVMPEEDKDLMRWNKRRRLCLQYHAMRRGLSVHWFCQSVDPIRRLFLPIGFFYPREHYLPAKANFFVWLIWVAWVFSQTLNRKIHFLPVHIGLNDGWHHCAVEPKRVWGYFFCRKEK